MDRMNRMKGFGFYLKTSLFFILHILLILSKKRFLCSSLVPA